MSKSKIIILSLTAFFVAGYIFYQNLITPNPHSQKKANNLPWQIEVIDNQTSKIFGLNLGKFNLQDAVNTFKSEYHLAWFEKEDGTITLESYFKEVILSGLHAKIVLELDNEGLDIEFLKKNSGKPEILESHSIKYPLDDLRIAYGSKLVKSISYIPNVNVPKDIIKTRFGDAKEILKLSETTEYWLYPNKGLVIGLSSDHKEVFQYIPLRHFERLRKSIEQTVLQAKNK